MHKGIWEEFDGFDDIRTEIEASRVVARKRSFTLDFADQYIDRLHPQRMNLEVADIIPEASDTLTFRLAPTDAMLPPFLAGQYLALYLEVDGICTSRPYSISSAPNQVGYYDITVKRVPNGLVSNFLLDRIRRGDRLTTSGPQGNFYFNPLVHGNTMICIAGGSGITPFMSMIREIVERNLSRNLILYYGNRSSNDIIFHEPLSQIASAFERIHYIPVIENASHDYGGQCGLITADLLKETAGSMEAATFFLCGPQGMYDFCLSQIDQLGIPHRKIRRELYGPPVDISQDPAWPPDIEPDHQYSVSIKAGPSMCRVKVLAGKVFQPANTPVRKSDTRYGYVHACVSYPLTDLEILI